MLVSMMVLGTVALMISDRLLSVMPFIPVMILVPDWVMLLF